MANRTRRCLFGIIGLFFFCCFLVLYHASSLLVVHDFVEKADAIVVPGGGYKRALYAADLYLKGHAGLVYLSRVPDDAAEELAKLGILVQSQEQVYAEIMQKKGVPPRSVKYYGKVNRSTIQEAEAFRESADKRIRSVIIVTSPYHTYRAKMIFSNVLKEMEVNVDYTRYEPVLKKWWADKDTTISVLSEITKIIFYKLGGRY